MREVSYTDHKGRMWMVRLPNGAPDSDAPLGIPIGPHSLEELGLSEELEVALHNQLFSRKIFTSRDVKAKRAEVILAIKGALKLDSEKIYALFLNTEVGNNINKSSPS